jgi:hypothetical protein
MDDISIYRAVHNDVTAFNFLRFTGGEVETTQARSSPYRCQRFCVRNVVGPYRLSETVRHIAKVQNFSRIILSTLVTDPIFSPSSMPGNSSVHVENELMEMTYDTLTHALPQLKFPYQRVLRYLLLNFWCALRPRYFGIRCQHSWSPKIVYYIVRMADSPMEEGLDIEKGMDTALYFN